MLLEEANGYLEKAITIDELLALNSLYLTLDLDKQDFCRIVDAVGAEKLVARQHYYNFVFNAVDDAQILARRNQAARRLEELKLEVAMLEAELGDE